MENKKLGQEPAFPPSREMQELSPDCEGYHVGMSKRFYAACAAMQGILASSKFDVVSGYGAGHDVTVARKAFEFADELLRREQWEN